jgi:sulfite exporter TauE/SafE/copper chaperone CopZ
MTPNTALIEPSQNSASTDIELVPDCGQAHNAGGTMATTSTTATTETSVIPVTGMTCTACERRVTKSLMKLPGVKAVEVSSTRGTATISGSHLPSRDRIDAAIRAAGYEPVAPKWLSLDMKVWRPVTWTALTIGWIYFVVTASGIASNFTGFTDASRGGLVVALTLGLTAGVSTCMAMVGGLVLGISASHAAKLAASGRTMPSFAHRMRPHLVFNLGRIVGFGILGALLGLLGSSLSLPTRLMAILVLVVALVMFLLGVRLTGISPRMAAWSPKLPDGLARTIGINNAADGSYSDVRTALVGAATFFLPCGFTQAVQIYAISTANPLTAGLVMATFAVGTTPGLLALATVPEVATGDKRVTVLRVVGVVVLAFALLNFSSGLNLLGITRASAPSASGVTLSEQVASDNVSVANGVQTVSMTQGPSGYEPAFTTIYAGLPTKWVINSTSAYDCSAFLRVPQLGQQINLVQGENTVDLGTLEAGSIPFTCVMGMYNGTLNVVPQPAPKTTTGNAAAAGTVTAPAGAPNTNVAVQGPTAG